MTTDDTSATAQAGPGQPGQPDHGDPVGLMDVDGRLKEAVVLDDHEERSVVHRSMIQKVASAMVTVVACVLVAAFVPGMEYFRPLGADDPVPFWNLVGRPFESEADAQKRKAADEADAIARDVLAEAGDPTPTPPPTPIPVDPEFVLERGGPQPEYAGHPDDDKKVAQSLELFTGHELDGFFESLLMAELRRGGPVRVAHWGDSSIGVDGIPGAIRARMQARFGDAGHGFHAMARPNTSYRHHGIKFSAEKWKICFIIRRCHKSDGHYGLAGVTTSSPGGGDTTIATKPAGQDEAASTVSRFELWYAGRPRGGDVRLKVDGGDSTIIETRAEALEDRWHTIEVPDGEHELNVRAVGGGSVRLYGVVLERDVPGVVWDSLALVGAFTNRLLYFDPDHLRAQLQHRQTELVVFTFGGNDMIRDSMSMEQYEREFRDVVRSVRSARPEAACLVMSPLDHGLRKGARIVSMKIVPKMVDTQRAVAKAEGCAFFDTYLAMGGDGSAGRWHKQKPRLVSGDLSHVTLKGQVVIGEMFYRALMARYAEYRGSEVTLQREPPPSVDEDEEPAAGPDDEIDGEVDGGAVLDPDTDTDARTDTDTDIDTEDTQ